MALGMHFFTEHFNRIQKENRNKHCIKGVVGTRIEIIAIEVNKRGVICKLMVVVSCILDFVVVRSLEYGPNLQVLGSKEMPFSFYFH